MRNKGFFCTLGGFLFAKYSGFHLITANPFESLPTPEIFSLGTWMKDS